MIRLIKESKLLHFTRPEPRHINNNDHILAFERANLLFVFNFHPVKSYFGYGLSCPAGKFRIILDSDNAAFGGQSRIDESLTYRTVPEKNFAPNQMLQLYLPSRTALVFIQEGIKSVYDLGWDKDAIFVYSAIPVAGIISISQVPYPGGEREDHASDIT